MVVGLWLLNGSCLLLAGGYCWYRWLVIGVCCLVVLGMVVMVLLVFGH